MEPCVALWRAVADWCRPLKMMQSRLDPAVCSTVGCSLREGWIAVCRMVDWKTGVEALQLYLEEVGESELVGSQVSGRCFFKAYHLGLTL